MAAAGLSLVALTDHDTLAGVPAARAAAQTLGVTVVAGCEFSVAAAWGEMHLLAYYLPEGQSDLEDFLEGQRAGRAARGEAIVRRLDKLGVPVTHADVLAAAGKGAVGRPHVARALVERRLVRNVQEAFDRYLGTGRPAYVAKELPPLARVVDLVRGVGGVTSAAHLGDRADPQSLEQLKRVGLDAVEVVHPSHNAPDRRRIERNARHAGLLLTGGSDWHGDSRVDRNRGGLGADTIPEEWVEAIRAAHQARAAGMEVAR